jgi:hypothetical protein
LIAVESVLSNIQKPNKMKIQKLLLAIVVGFIVMFGLAGLFHLVIMKDFFMEKLGGEPSIHYAMLSYAFLAILMSYIYPFGYKGGSPVKEGLIFGILMGLLCRLPLQVLEMGYGRVDLSFVVTEAVWHMVEEGIGGIAIAMVYGKMMIAPK